MLGGDSGWRSLDVVTETGSTNADLLAAATAGRDIAGTVLLAEAQTSGRGRNGRSWATVPHAQVTLSVGVDASAVPSDAWGWLPLATGIAVVDAVGAVGSVRAGVKWPNDVLGGLDSTQPPLKLAGILAEVAARQPVIVVGIGLNVSLRDDEAGEPIASMASLGATSLDRTLLAGRLLVELDRRVAQWRAQGGADGDGVLLQAYLARSLTVGSPVRAVLPGDRTVVGTAVAIDAEGRLRIDTGTEIVTVSAGDVIHVRPPAG